MTKNITLLRHSCLRNEHDVLFKHVSLWQRSQINLQAHDDKFPVETNTSKVSEQHFTAISHHVSTLLSSRDHFKVSVIRILTYDLSMLEIPCQYITNNGFKISIYIEGFDVIVEEVVVLQWRTALYKTLSCPTFMLIPGPQQEIRYLREIQLRATFIVATGCF
jgi:hypothetical protein